MINAFQEVALLFKKLDNLCLGYNIFVFIITMAVYMFTGCTGIFFSLPSYLMTVPVFIINSLPYIFDLCIMYQWNWINQIMSSKTDLLLFLVSTSVLLSILLNFFGVYLILIGCMFYLHKFTEQNIVNFISLFIISISLFTIISLMYSLLQNIFSSLFFSAISSYMILLGIEKVGIHYNFSNYLLTHKTVSFGAKPMLVYLVTFMFFFGLQLALSIVTSDLLELKEIEDVSVKKKKKGKRK